jgi:hypothetical protein
MTAALAVIAAVALLAIVMLVVTARRATTRVAQERARANRLEAQVRALENAASRPAAVSDAGGVSGRPGGPIVPAEDAEPEVAIASPAEDAEPEVAIAPPADDAEPEVAIAPRAEDAEPQVAIAPPAGGAQPEPASPPAADEHSTGAGPRAETPLPAEEPAPAASVPADEPAPEIPLLAEEPTPAAGAAPGPGEEPAGVTPALAATPVPADEPTPAAGAPASIPVAANEPAPAAATPAASTGAVPAGETWRPTSVPTEGAGTNSHGVIAAEPLWELERLRLEREWADIVGSSTPLPVTWDRSVRSVVAVELDIIREVIGTPSRIMPATSSQAAEPAAAVAAARLATEILRRLAKAGEEIEVTFQTDTDVTMSVAVVGDEVKPDLSELTTTAAELGGRLTLVETEDGFEAQLQVPSPRS